MGPSNKREREKEKERANWEKRGKTGIADWENGAEV